MHILIGWKCFCNSFFLLTERSNVFAIFCSLKAFVTFCSLGDRMFFAIFRFWSLNVSNCNGFSAKLPINCYLHFDVQLKLLSSSSTFILRYEIVLSVNFNCYIFELNFIFELLNCFIFELNFDFELLNCYLRFQANVVCPSLAVCFETLKHFAFWTQTERLVDLIFYGIFCL